MIDFSRLSISGASEEVPASYSKRSRPDTGKPTPRDREGRVLVTRAKDLERRSYYDMRQNPAFKLFGTGTDEQMKWYNQNWNSEPRANETLQLMLTNNKVLKQEGDDWVLAKPRRGQTREDLTPPKPNQMGLVANSGTVATIPSVLASAMESKPLPGTLALAGSSSDSAATYRQAHAAAERADVDTDPMNRVNMLYEAQLARALSDSYTTWFEDKKQRDDMCRELVDATTPTSSTPMLTDAAMPGAVSKKKGSK